MHDTGGNARVVGALLGSFMLAACGSSVEAPPAQTDEVLEDASVPCEFMDRFDNDVVEGSGFEDATSAFEAFLLEEDLSAVRGEPEIDQDVLSDKRVVWVFRENGAEVGSVTAELLPWGLWQVMSGSFCVDG